MQWLRICEDDGDVFHGGKQALKILQSWLWTWPLQAYDLGADGGRNLNATATALPRWRRLGKRCAERICQNLFLVDLSISMCIVNQVLTIESIQSIESIGLKRQN